MFVVSYPQTVVAVSGVIIIFLEHDMTVLPNMLAITGEGAGQRLEQSLFLVHSPILYRLLPGATTIGVVNQLRKTHRQLLDQRRNGKYCNGKYDNRNKTRRSCTS